MSAKLRRPAGFATSKKARICTIFGKLFHELDSASPISIPSVLIFPAVFVAPEIILVIMILVTSASNPEKDKCNVNSFEEDIFSLRTPSPDVLLLLI